jgi:transcription initiation factor TFIIH subunit 4
MAVALSVLRKLAIWEEDAGVLNLSHPFKMGLRRALQGTTTNESGDAKMAVATVDRMDPKQLDRYAHECFDSVLHFIVGSSLSKPLSQSLLRLLVSSGLMSHHPSHETLTSSKTKLQVQEMRITNKGFQFLLEDTHAQVWRLVLQYVELSEQLGLNVIDVLTFFFQLGCLDVGVGYGSDMLSEVQQRLLQDLSELGLLYRKSETVFYPTRLALMLSTGASGQQQTSTAREAFLIVETNYRIHAYTSSPLQICVLSMFTHLKARFGDMIVGQITRESVLRALQNGISAKQIVAYLTAHAHPLMRAKTPVIPPTVADQLALWELQRNRLILDEGYLYNHFGSEDEYAMALKYAEDVGILLWSNRTKMALVVSQEGHAMLRAYLISKR